MRLCISRFTVLSNGFSEFIGVIWALFAIACLVFFIILVSISNQKQSEGVQYIANSVQSVLFPFTRGGVIGLPDNMHEDKYIIGFLHCTMAMQMKTVFPEASKDKYGEILIDAAKICFRESWRKYIDQMNYLVRIDDNEYKRGVEHAANVIGLARQTLKPEFMTLPEIQVALKNAHKASDGEGSYFDASALLLANYIMEHKSLHYPELN